MVQLLGLPPVPRHPDHRRSSMETYDNDEICVLLKRGDAELHCEHIRDVIGAFRQAAEYEQKRLQGQRAQAFYCRAESMRELLEAIEYGLMMDAPSAEAEAVVA